jgi:hypothetical protein
MSEERNMLDIPKNRTSDSFRRLSRDSARNAASRAVRVNRDDRWFDTAFSGEEMGSHAEIPEFSEDRENRRDEGHTDHAGILKLLEEWSKDETGYDAEVWPCIRDGLEKNRAPGRRLFRDGEDRA